MDKEEIRIAVVLRDLEKHQEDSWRPFQSKSTAESIRARKEGNKLYSIGQHTEKMHVEILRHYNRSCAFALPGSPELGLALGNRSALLMHLRRYADCLKDLDQALNLPLLDNLLTAKYLTRKAECHKHLAQLSDARDACEEAQLLLDGIDGDERQKRTLMTRLIAVLSEPIEARNHETSRPELTLATDAVLEERRSLQAARDLGPGEALLAIQPYVVCPQEASLHSSCSHCLRFCWAALPCESCAHAIYCSELCRTTALRDYHEQECRVIDGIWRLDGQRGAARLLSLRLLIRAMSARSGNLEALREDLDAIETLLQPSNNHTSVLGLPDRASKKLNEELITISLDSAILLKLLSERTLLFRKYFSGDGRELSGNKDALFVGRLISHYQHIVIANAHAIKDAYTRTASTNWTWKNMDEKNCCGLYITPYLSLLRHSCDPNIKRCEMEDGRTVLYTIKPISKGEKLFDCYGPTYFEMVKAERQELISKYYLVCKCVACVNNWPIYKKLLKRNVKFLSLSGPQVDATLKAQQKCDEIITSLKNGKANYDVDTLRDLSYGVYLTAKFCSSPNWRLPNLVTALTAVFNDLYGYVIDDLVKC